MKKLIPILVAFVLVAILIAKLYDTSINRPAMVFKDIPQETMQWVNELKEGSKGGGLDMNASQTGPFNWKNADDYLSKPSTGMSKWGKQESDNAVVYYYKDKEAVWQGNALSALNCVQEAIPELERLYGKYYYPQDMNGRKLAIYLADSTSHYETIVRKLTTDVSTLRQMDELDGLLVMEVGPLGCRVKGIVLHPDCFKRGSTKYKYVLRKEMALVCFYASLDYGKEIKHYKWFSDGLADYFAMYCPMLEAVDDETIEFIEKKCMLDQEFPDIDEMGLEAANSFFRFYADKKGYGSLSGLVQSAYEISADSLFEKNGLDRDELKEEWLREVKRGF